MPPPPSETPSSSTSSSTSSSSSNSAAHLSIAAHTPSCIQLDYCSYNIVFNISYL